MSDFDRASARSIPSAADMSIDVGLRKFMLGVYNKLGLGLLLSAGMAYLTSGPLRPLMFRVAEVTLPDGGAVQTVGYTGLGWIVAFAPLAILLFSGFVMRSINARTASLIYWSIVALIGASLGTVVLLYTGASVVSTFLITATAFGSLSLVGYTTKKNLTGMGSFLLMGLVGLIIAMVVNMFIQNDMMAFIISVVGVLIFAGLVAYDTQRLKMTYYQLGGDETAMSVATSYGALNLYLDFINLFRFLLVLFGSRR
ncbi:MAG TPA: Bax inhibitor-1/YccA family protein [Caulobacteraceae bacterium]|nr:Bax inhibitor-1/YccA family protein [Caulobacteraceae bacterium]